MAEKIIDNKVNLLGDDLKADDVMSLLKGDIEGLSGNKIKGLDDFELIAFVVVK